MSIKPNALNQRESGRKRRCGACGRQWCRGWVGKREGATLLMTCRSWFQMFFVFLQYAVEILFWCLVQLPSSQSTKRLLRCPGYLYDVYIQCIYIYIIYTLIIYIYIYTVAERRDSYLLDFFVEQARGNPPSTFKSREVSWFWHWESWKY